MNIPVEIVNKSSNPNPVYARNNDSGCDVMANLENIKEKFLFNAELVEAIDGENEKCIVVHPGGRCLVPTGHFVAIPAGYEIQVRPRSGNALKLGITVLNTPGTVDAGYRDEIGVIIINHSDEHFLIFQGDKIAQYVLTKVETIEWVDKDQLNETDRTGGFGSTNK